MTFSGSKVFSGSPCVLYGSSLGLQNNAICILPGQMEGLIPRAWLSHTFCICFSSKTPASGSDLQKHILLDSLLVLNTGCIPSIPLSHVMSWWAGSQDCILSVLSRPGWGLVPAWQAVLMRACQPEGGVSPCNSAAQEAAFVICWPTLSVQL